MVLGKMDIHMKLDLYVTPYTEINSKWIEHPNFRKKNLKILKCLEETIRGNHDV